MLVTQSRESTAEGGAVRRRTPWCLLAALLAGTTLVVTTAFEWSIVDVITPFLLIPLLGALWLSLGASAIWAIVHAIRNHRDGWEASLPLLVCVTAGLVTAFVPFTEIWVDANFHLLRRQREEVVHRIQAGALRPDDGHEALISLGRTFPALSTGGNEILVEKHGGQDYVFFFTYRGILDNYSGFLYVPKGGDPRSFSDLDEAESTQLEPLGNQWYFASHH